MILMQFPSLNSESHLHNHEVTMMQIHISLDFSIYYLRAAICFCFGVFKMLVSNEDGSLIYSPDLSEGEKLEYEWRNNSEKERLIYQKEHVNLNFIQFIVSSPFLQVSKQTSTLKLFYIFCYLF